MPVPLRLAAAALFLLGLPLRPAPAQGPAAAAAPDRIVMRTGETQVGRVLGVRDGQVQVEINAGAIGFPLERIASVEMPVPAGLAAAQAASEKGEFDRALAAVRPVAEGFRGLPTDWARAALGLLGDLYVEKNDLPRAEAAYNDLRRLYGTAAGGSTARASVGQARLLLARQNPAGARQLLEPLAANALRDPVRVSRAEGAAYGQTFLLLGQIREGAGDFAGALENYLRASTLFAAQDRRAAVTAQKAADTLRAAHPGLIAP